MPDAAVGYKPRIFVSAVTEEFGTVRAAVANVVRSLRDCEATSQADFPAAHGNLLDWLRTQIDSCHGLIQIAGAGYGAEPPEPTAEFGRVSYTQFEFLHARKKGKTTWLIIADDKCERDKRAELLDRPKGIPDSEADEYQQTRRALQEEYLAQIKKKNHAWHNAATLKDVENIVLKADLKGDYVQWTKIVLVSVLVILCLILVTGATSFFDLRSQIVQARNVDREAIRAQLRRSVNEAYERELEAAARPENNENRQELLADAEANRASRLQRIDALVQSIGDLQEFGKPSDVFTRASQLLEDKSKGVDAAIAYLESRQAGILEESQLEEAAHQQARRMRLQPSLLLAELYSNAGKTDAARKQYAILMKHDKEWPEMLNSYFWFLIDQNQGYALAVRSPLNVAERDFNEAHRLAQQLVALDGANPEWQHNLAVSFCCLARITATNDLYKETTDFLQKSLDIDLKLVKAAPGEPRWQESLALSYRYLGHIANRVVDHSLAAEHYERAMKITQTLVALDPLNLEYQDDLALDLQLLGDISIDNDDLETAERVYRESQRISTELVREEQANVEWQRRLSHALEGLAEIAIAREDFEKAAEFYRASVPIADQLVRSDPSNHQLRRELEGSYNLLADVVEKLGDYQTAVKTYDQSYKVAKQLLTENPESEVFRNDLAEICSWRGESHKRCKQFPEALKDREESVILAPDNPGHVNDLVWMLATCPIADLRDGKRAVQLAEKLRELSKTPIAGRFDTIAAAYARNQQFDLAVQSQQAALDLAPENEKADFQERLSLYLQEKPYPPE